MKVIVLPFASSNARPEAAKLIVRVQDWKVRKLVRGQDIAGLGAMPSGRFLV